MLLNELVVFSPRQTQAEYLDSAAPSLAESLVSLTCVPPPVSLYGWAYADVIT